jgi:hypothetical protein
MWYAMSGGGRTLAITPVLITVIAFCAAAIGSTTAETSQYWEGGYNYADYTENYYGFRVCR